MYYFLCETDNSFDRKQNTKLGLCNSSFQVEPLQKKECDGGPKKISPSSSKKKIQTILLLPSLF